MRILLVHNQYKQAGGEDAVFQAESKLLLSHGHEVQHMLYHNSEIESLWDKLKAGFKSLYNPDSARSFRIRIRNFKPDVIHVHNFLPQVSPSIFFVARSFKVPIVLTLHNYRLICPSATLFFNGSIYENSTHAIFPFDAIWKGVYRNSKVETAIVAFMTALHNVLGTWRNRISCYIALTQFSKEKFKRSTLNIPAERLLVKPNFVEDFGEGEQTREDFFLFIGRLTEEKGISVLLKAAALKRFKLVIIGDGPLRKLVENSAKQNPSINYLGQLDKGAVIGYLKKCTALIFPSIWYEGFPVTILEAFATGTPIIASRLGSMQEIVQHKVNGLHFVPNEPADLILKITELSQNSTLAQSLAANARATYLELYAPEKNYWQLLSIYKHAMKHYGMDGNKSNAIPLPERQEYVDV